jgi:hypothetical protein
MQEPAKDEADEKCHTIDCLGRRDEFASWWSFSFLLGTWITLLWYLNVYYLARSKFEPMDAIDPMTEIVKVIIMLALFVLVAITSMITMPRCGGIQLDRIRHFIRSSAHEQKTWAKYVFTLLPRLSDRPCCGVA